MATEMKKRNKKSLAKESGNKIPKAVCNGEIVIRKNSIPCAVLEGGVRIFSQRKLREAFGQTPTSTVKYDSLPSIISANNLQPYINDEILEAVTIIKYQPQGGGSPAYGVKAESLPMICEIFINADAAGVLKKVQIPTAERCRSLQNGFARLGVIALIDEATGYQDVRAKKALAEILEKYLSSEEHKWNKTFPLEFYREIYRLKGWKWTELENGKKPRTPQIVGKYTDECIYKRLAPGILKELRARNSDRRVRHHQWFNTKHGHPALQKHIAEVILIMRVSDNWQGFLKNLNKIHPVDWEEGDGMLFYKNSSEEKKKEKFSAKK